MPQIDKRIKPKVMIVAFPSFGFVGNIAVEFLQEHLKTEKIGRLFLDEMLPIIVVHNSKIVEPISFYYNNRYKLVLVQGINKISGLENKIASRISNFVHKYKIREVVTIDGVPGVGSNIYYYSRNKPKLLEDAGVKFLTNGLVFGITSSLILRLRNVVSLFAESQSELPDSNAAARVIKVLDKYLGLKVDYEPLFEQAKKFEKRIKDILEKSQEAKSKQDETKKLSYLG